MSPFLVAFRKAIYEKPIEFVMMTVTVLGLAVGLVGATFVYFQFLDLRKNLDSQAYGLISQELVELDKIFVEHPDMRPYFHLREPLPDDDAKKQRVLAIADIYLDFIDNYYSQASHLDWSHYNRGGWDVFFRRSFERSPVLCFVLCMDQDEYGNATRGMAVGICKGVTLASAETASVTSGRRTTERSESSCKQP